MKPGNAGTDRALASALSRWFARCARPLPWRTSPRDPFRSLVSEFMLQQTQVSRVLEKFGPFMARFPTPGALADADARSVLAAWSGLGYYRRARHLHAAAKALVSRHREVVPSDVEALMALPGVGRYTAGSIASIVFGKAAPIVDGNVTRVLLRLHGKPLAHGSPQASRWSWERAETLVVAARSPALFNEGLMELGATVCTPRTPDCGRCPLRASCVARAKGLQHSIPSPKRVASRRPLHCASILITDARGRVLVEPRPASGLWADLWQAPTLESAEAPPARAELRRWIGLDTLTAEGSFRHGTTHRDVFFHVWRSQSVDAPTARRLRSVRLQSRWLPRSKVSTLPLSNPQSRILLNPLP